MTDATAQTLAEFLLARIAEDEATADELHWETCEHLMAREIGGFPCDCWYPQRVLAECAAKRAIVEAHPLTTNVVPVWRDPTPGYACERCAKLSQISEDAIVEDIGACDTLRALAGVYADHLDYREEWRP